jgi:hypothetical protein
MTRTRSHLVLCADCGTLLERKQAVTNRQRLECLMCVVESALTIVDKAQPFVAPRRGDRHSRIS